MLNEAGSAFLTLMDPTRLFFLFGGVMVGLSLGVIPGLGGIVGMALLLPFTFSMDPYSAMALLLGMGSVTTTSDTIPAVLFGVPGTTGSAATVLDGHPLAKQGQAGRAFGAAYSASLIGGLFGALLLAVSIPVLRPIMLYIGSPELLAISFFGLSMVAVLSGRAPLRGLAGGCLGLMIAMIGSDPQSGTLRWTMGTLYLFDGLSLVPITLGLFAIPELADMAISRKSIAGDHVIDSRSGQWQGVKDTFTHWWLTLRCAWLGASLGAVPGLGAAVIDWIAYGHAVRTEKNTENFGKGDIRGVIASEASNNAKEGGALVPTIAFGVPGSASMAILLGAFLIHGLIPGPEMLTTHLDVTYTMIWSVALANVLGTGLCFMFSNQFAKVAILRIGILLPLVMTVVFIGAFQGSRQWGDLFAIMIFGFIGWSMKRMGWPRPPVILGVVLGDIIERYMFISVGRYGASWLLRPAVVAIFLLTFWGLTRGFFREIRRTWKQGGSFGWVARPQITPGSLYTFGFLILLIVLYQQALGWNLDAKIVPLIVGGIALVVVTLSLVNQAFREQFKVAGNAPATTAEVVGRMDLQADDGLEVGEVVRRAANYFGWLLGFLGLIALIGMIPAVFAFVLFYIRLQGKESWRMAGILAVCVTLFNYFLFDQLLSLPWPRSFLGDLFPILRDFIPSL